MKVKVMITREMDKLTKKISLLREQLDNYQKALDVLNRSSTPKEPEPVSIDVKQEPEYKVLVCCHESTAGAITTSTTMGYFINKNPNVTRDITDMVKNKAKVYVYDDSLNTNEHEILVKLGTHFGITFWEKSNG